jgi:prevent-host-death family protein
MKKMAASEFKAHCLAVLDEVARTGEPLLIVKRGRPVAQLIAPVSQEGKSPQDSLRGTVEFVGDVVGPVVPASDWDVESGE